MRFNVYPNNRVMSAKTHTGDWPDEYQQQENGAYLGECAACGNSYVGPKHSFVCWPCKTEAKEHWDSLSEEERKQEKERFAGW